MIELRNLSKKFENNVVLNHINLTFKKGNIYVIKGVSGSGKSTLFNIISGLDKEYDGNVLINNHELKAMNTDLFEDYRNKIGYMMQKSLLFRNLTILENLKFIEDNEEEIYTLAKKFKIDDLLNKKPNQLSGGEKQRVSLIRTLLNNHEVIIADEPTASLDYKNSENFVEYLKDIDISNKIVIIATHKNIYDKVANYIINIEYGNISIKELEKQELKNHKHYDKSEKVVERDLRNDFRYIKKNRIVHNKFVSIFLIFLFLLLFMLLSLKINFRNEYIKYSANIYPYDIIDLPVHDAEYISEIVEYQYEEYNIIEKEYTAYSLLPKEDSNFKIPNLITYGHYPKQKNGIIANREFIDLFFPNTKYDEVIGKTIVVKDNSFVIEGIVELTENNYVELYVCNYFYRNINSNGVQQSNPAIFIPYNIMKEIGTKAQDTPFNRILVKIKSDRLIDLYTGNIYDKTQNVVSDAYSTWENRIASILKDADFVANVGMLCFCVFGILSIIFIGNQLHLELFYRRKEIGYLQIFNLNKLEIIIIFIGEYLFEILKLIIYAFLIYLMLILFIYIGFHVNFLLPIEVIILLFIVLILYCCLVIYLPIRKYLKKDIIELIKN